MASFGRSDVWVKYHSRVVCSFFLLFSIPNFACVLRLNRKHILCGLDHASGYWLLSLRFLHFYPPRHPKKAWIGIVKPKTKYSKNFHYQPTEAIPTKFCTVMKTTKYSLWSSKNLPTNPKWQTAAILKTVKRYISSYCLTDFDEIWYDYVHWPCQPKQSTKHWKIWKAKTVAILKIEKLPYLQNRLADFDHVMHLGPPYSTRQ